MPIPISNNYRLRLPSSITGANNTSSQVSSNGFQTTLPPRPASLATTPNLPTGPSSLGSQTVSLLLQEQEELTKGHGGGGGGGGHHSMMRLTTGIEAEEAAESEEAQLLRRRKKLLKAMLTHKAGETPEADESAEAAQKNPKDPSRPSKNKQQTL